LLQTAREQLQFEWMFCFDPDERVTGDLRGFMERTHSSDYDGVRVQLFDAYMTPGDHAAYQADRELLDFRRFFGPERRDILMLWRNRPEVIFAKREPGGLERVGTDLHCQHYGKSLSVDHWEETCDYYIRHFPFDTYGRKWLERKGQAIHTQSDFMRPLYEWGDTLPRECGQDVNLSENRRGCDVRFAWIEMNRPKPALAFHKSGIGPRSSYEGCGEKCILQFLSRATEAARQILSNKNIGKISAISALGAWEVRRPKLGWRATTDDDEHYVYAIALWP
jgi:hypothetical protein